jgi:DNA-binding transcriptional regulator YdaS (Cro superfamily)
MCGKRSDLLSDERQAECFTGGLSVCKIADMKLSDFLKEADQDLLAAKAGTNRAYLYQLSTGHRKASPKLARKIHEATAGAVGLADLRPDVWGSSSEEESSKGH